jgi:hypothetical protein
MALTKGDRHLAASRQTRANRHCARSQSPFVSDSKRNLSASFDVGNPVRIEPQHLLSSLPIVVKIINLIRIVRGGIPNT